MPYLDDPKSTNTGKEKNCKQWISMF